MTTRGDIMKNYHILVVEDDQEIQELIKQFLMTQQYTVVVASDGLEGMTQFNKQSFDLVLLDVMMPNLNGFEVAKMIQVSQTYQLLC